MSHFSVLVVGEDIESQLEPFWELDLHQDEAAMDHRAEFTPEISNDAMVDEYAKFLVDHEDYEGKYETIEDWIRDWHGYVYSEEYDSWGYWSNPNAKWDWWCLGGRWAGFLKLKSHRVGLRSDDTSWIFRDKDPYKEGYVDSAKMGDINWKVMHFDNRVEAEKSWEEWEKYKAEKLLIPEEEFKERWENYLKRNSDNSKVTTETLSEFKEACIEEDGYWRFGVRKGETKEKYIARREIPSTFAVVKDGEWYEKGNMGWWGIVTDEKDCKDWQETFAELLEDIDPETRVSVVDCHI